MTTNGEEKTSEILDTRQKALRINLDLRRYGTFAEIGAGQEVVRWFFRVGGAAGTIAKSISAYDMAVSDAYYGPCERYVCRQRLQSMLDYEYAHNLSQLDENHLRQRALGNGFGMVQLLISLERLLATTILLPHTWLENHPNEPPLFESIREGLQPTV